MGFGWLFEGVPDEFPPEEHLPDCSTQFGILTDHGFERFTECDCGEEDSQ